MSLGNIRGKGKATANTAYDPKDLIERCKRGDRSGWEEFYARYHGMVSCAVRRIGPTGREDVEDTVQEVFIHLIRALQQYDPSKPLEVYILEIARRVRISSLRRASAMKRGGSNPRPVPVDAHDGNYEGGFVSLASEADSQEDSLMKAQQTMLLRRALADLSEACQRLLGMRYYDGLSYKEIAELLRVREGTLRVQAQRCMTHLSRNYARLAPQEVGNR